MRRLYYIRVLVVPAFMSIVITEIRWSGLPEISIVMHQLQRPHHSIVVQINRTL